MELANLENSVASRFAESAAALAELRPPISALSQQHRDALVALDGVLRRLTAAEARLAALEVSLARRLWRWLTSRIRSMIGTYKPPERRVLLGLAAFRAVFTFSCGVACGLLLPTPWGWLLSPGAAVLASVISADFIEHYARVLFARFWPKHFGAFGPIAYNPWVSAIGEWEGYMGPTDKAYADAWNAAKYGPQPPTASWWGDVESFGHRG